MKRIAVISAILENPEKTQEEFNHIVSSFKGVVKGRLGIPFDREDIAVIALTVVSELDDINAFTGKLGAIEGATVKTAIARKQLESGDH